MKVLTVVRDLKIGGTQRVAQNMAIGLLHAGTETAVLAHSGGGPRETALRAAGVPLFVAGGGATPAEAVRAATGWSADVVHIHREGRPDPVETDILRLLRGRGARVVETNVFSRYDWTEGGDLIDAHCHLSNWCAFKWHAWGGRKVANKRAYLLPSAVDVDSIGVLTANEREEVREGLGVPADAFLFGRVGQPIEAKWSTKIFKSFAAVAIREPNTWLLLVGAPPSHLAAIGGLPEAVRNRIVCRPVTTSDSELKRYFGVLDAFLHLAAIGESFGMVLCEAMMVGVPVVTLSTPLRDNSQLEVVGHEIGGLIALDPDAVPEAMVRVMHDESLRKKVQLQGRAWVANRFQVDTVVSRLLRICDAVRGGDSDPLRDLETEIDRDRINRIARSGIGNAFDPIERMLFSIIHTPEFYRLYFAGRALIGGRA